ncbi:MAG: hypothetical protein R6U35_06555 [Candidatus Humimicrobiaceae bacterium]
MDRVNKYIKLAKNILIKPVDEDVQDKIIDRISNIDESDKVLLDEEFLEYLRKNNSRLYLMAEKIKNNPLQFTLVLIFFLFLMFLLGNAVKKFSLSSPEDKSQEK